MQLQFSHANNFADLESSPPASVASYDSRASFDYDRAGIERPALETITYNFPTNNLIISEMSTRRSATARAPRGGSEAPSEISIGAGSETPKVQPRRSTRTKTPSIVSQAPKQLPKVSTRQDLSYGSNLVNGPRDADGPIVASQINDILDEEREGRPLPRNDSEFSDILSTTLHTY